MDVNLKTFRKKHGISQEKAAESIDIDQRQWSRYKRGNNEFPIRYLKALCQYWKESADEILEINKKNNIKKKENPQP